MAVLVFSDLQQVRQEMPYTGVLVWFVLLVTGCRRLGSVLRRMCFLRVLKVLKSGIWVSGSGKGILGASPW